MPHDTVIAGRPSTSEDLRSLEAGLDRLQTDAERPGARGRDILSSILLPVAFVAILLIAWQLFVVIAEPRPDRLPSPLAVAGALGDAWEAGRLQLAVTTSLERGIVAKAFHEVLGVCERDAAVNEEGVHPERPYSSDG